MHGAHWSVRDGKEYPQPPYKLIILDEADSMTQDAQSALRRIMETYSKITRFCLVCNYVTRWDARSALSLTRRLTCPLCLFQRIIEPLASRCSKFRFKALDPSSTRARVNMIADAENVQMDDGVRPYKTSPSFSCLTSASLGRAIDSRPVRGRYEKGDYVHADWAAVAFDSNSANANNGRVG